MNVRNNISAACSLLSYILFRKKAPVAARINLTYKCPNKCAYCNIIKSEKEMTSKEVLELITQLEKLGIKRISFSGGEPMLKKDLGKIIGFCKERDIITSINTSGFNIEKRIRELKNINCVNISIDGNQKLNDRNRGKGSFNLAKKAIELCKKHRIPFSLSSTLTKITCNLDNISYLLSLAKKYSTKIAFQPYQNIYGRSNNALLPSKKQLKDVIGFLLKKKKKKEWKEHIISSKRLLNHMEEHPDYKKLNCVAGKLFFVVNPNGDLVPCDRPDRKLHGKAPNFMKVGVKEALRNMQNVNCSGCSFCGAMQLYYLSRLKLNVLLEMQEV